MNEGHRDDEHAECQADKQDNVDQVHDKPWKQEPTGTANTSYNLKSLDVKLNEKNDCDLTKRILAMIEYSNATSVRVSIGGMVQAVIPYRSSRIKSRKSSIFTK